MSEIFKHGRASVLTLLLFVPGMGVSEVKNGCLDSVNIYELKLAEDVTQGLRGRDLSGEHSLNIVSDPINEKSNALKFTLRPDDMVKKGNRAELIVNDFRGADYLYQYKADILVPGSFVSDSKWQVFIQWHDQPDVSVGETWQSLPSRAPPLALFYLDNEIYLIHRTSEHVFVKSEKITIKKDTWYEIVFTVRWSLGEDGEIAATINDQSFVQAGTKNTHFKGPNMYNKAGNYLKFGLYRDKGARSTNDIYFKDIKVDAACISPSEKSNQEP